MMIRMPPDEWSGGILNFIQILVAKPKDWILKISQKSLDKHGSLWYIIARKDESNVLVRAHAPEVRMQGHAQNKPKKK